MARVITFNKPKRDPGTSITVTPMTGGITDVRLALKIADPTVDPPLAALCSDNSAIAGFPAAAAGATTATAGESVKLERGYRTGVASGAVTFNDPITSAANGKIRTAVIGTDRDQGTAMNTAADGEAVTVYIP